MNRKVSIRRKFATKFAIKRREDSQEFAGLRLRKLPSDCLAILKLLYRVKPRVVVEMGSSYGGSALMIASWAEFIGLEEVISVDIQEMPRPSHPLIKFIVGNSAHSETVQKIYDLVSGRSCSLILDSNHHAPHVKKELELYHGLVNKGQALIVEDTLVDVLDFRKFRVEGGPLRALDDFLQDHPEFTEAEGIEPYVTTNFFGYLIHQ
jgi:cephalosporin hydroxylase